MKKVLVVAILICVCTSTAYSQTALNDYKKMDYISVEKENLQRFLTLSQQELKKIYNNLLESGAIKSWTLYHAKFPGGKQNSYDFISVVTASNIDSLLNLFNDIKNPPFIPSSTDKSNQKITNHCSVIKSEIWKVENMVSDGDTSNPPGKYVSMDYMRVAPGKGPDYLMLEEEIAKPIHQERINRDKMKGWHTYSLIAPSGSQYGYNYSTANFFENVSDLEFGFTAEIMNQTMDENADITELFNTIYETRDRIRVELWERFLYLN
ncbi:hypothetical protein [Fodinibius saliphilus]|uniref:hypothetical protein n=1 Tax=Fodinibius saliphilus TaxID=1920650 RepID=UPI001109F379|nr:hypothetical protein [Fodinibius saliphilus]